MSGVATSSVILLNPQSARWRFRLPLSILSLAAGLEGRYSYAITDGNYERNLEPVLSRRIESEGTRYLALTVMPGPQLQQAIPLTRRLKQRFPDLVTVWGGYFPSLHSETVLNSGFVDYVVRGPGERALPQLMKAVGSGGSLLEIPGLSYLATGRVQHNPIQARPGSDFQSTIPYHRVDINRYVGRTWLGRRTVAYHSSFGCPFTCGFCAVAALYGGSWQGKSTIDVTGDIIDLQRRYGIDSVEFIDNNFFVGEGRTAEIAEGLMGAEINWWGEARPDTVMGYSDTTWRTMARSGLKSMFFGVESSSAEVLEKMHKGGTQTPDMVLALAERARQFGVVPEFSFVLGTPSDDIDAGIDADIRYIRMLKSIHPGAEIIIYVYSPVFFDDADLMAEARSRGFRFPERLEDWMRPEWREFDLRKNPATPWLTPAIIRKIRNFEWVLNARYPTASDIKLRAWQITALKTLGAWRYVARFYNAPYEIRFVANRLFRYRQPEIEGFLTLILNRFSYKGISVD